MKCLILLLLCAGALADEDKTLGMSEANPASSRSTSIILLVGELLTSTGLRLMKDCLR